METKHSTKGMILDICSQRSRIQKNGMEFKDCSEVLNFLLEKDYYYDEDLTVPLMKEISKSLNLSNQKVRKQIEKIYSIIIDYDMMEKYPFNIETTEIYFFLSSYFGSNSASLKVTGLTFIPRKGEEVNIPYFKEHVGITSFYISDISTEFHDKKCEISLWLKPGSYNAYWELRKARAFEIGEIPLYDC